MTAPLVRSALSLFTTDEAAEILRVRRSWLERQAAARRIPFTLLGGCYRFTEAHLAEIVRIFEATPTPDAGQVQADQVAVARSRPRTRRNPASMSAPLRPRPRAHHDTQQRVA